MTSGGLCGLMVQGDFEELNVTNSVKDLKMLNWRQRKFDGQDLWLCLEKKVGRCHLPGPWSGTVRDQDSGTEEEALSELAVPSYS